MNPGTKAELIFIPCPARGHLLPALEMANLLVGRYNRLSITILVISPASGPTNDAAHFSDPNIRLVHIPPVECPSLPSDSSLSFTTRFIRSHKAHVRNEVVDLVKTRILAGFVIDLFCTSMIDVADEFNIPTYILFTASASVLGLMLHFQALRDYQGLDPTLHQDSDDFVLIPSFRFPVPAKLIPEAMFRKDLLDHARRFRETKGIMVNAFSEMEPHAIESLLVNNTDVPRVYPIGPVIHFGDSKQDEITRWLDEQPLSSVVFLCFGSGGWFGEIQIKEIARALEETGHRFLWSIRKQPEGRGFGSATSEYEDPGEVLPEGFVDRTAHIGKVVGWAPQVAVLSHPSVGGFVSHCGWNSVLESLWCGVPMAAWPLYAEHKANAFQMVKDLGAAVEIKMEYKMGGDVVVTAEEIGDGIRRLMEPESDVRTRVQELKGKSRKAVGEYGSGSEFVGRFIADVMANYVTRTRRKPATYPCRHDTTLTRVRDLCQIRSK